MKTEYAPGDTAYIREMGQTMKGTVLFAYKKEGEPHTNYVICVNDPSYPFDVVRDYLTMSETPEMPWYDKRKKTKTPLPRLYGGYAQ